MGGIRPPASDDGPPVLAWASSSGALSNCLPTESPLYISNLQLVGCSRAVGRGWTATMAPSQRPLSVISLWR